MVVGSRKAPVGQSGVCAQRGGIRQGVKTVSQTRVRLPLSGPHYPQDPRGVACTPWAVAPARRRGARDAECSPICRVHSGLVPLPTSIYLSRFAGGPSKRRAKACASLWSAARSPIRSTMAASVTSSSLGLMGRPRTMRRAF